MSLKMMKIFTLSLLVVIGLARTYPMYKQCDSRWAVKNSELLATQSAVPVAPCHHAPWVLPELDTTLTLPP
jgi:hypothetical protein